MEQSTHYDVCVLGSANSDLFLKVKAFPKSGETINALDQFIKNGGKGANQAVASARLGSKNVFAGQMGKDSMADLLIKEMTESGVSLAGLVQVNHVQTGQAIILLDENGENSIVIIGGANMQQEALLDQFKQVLVYKNEDKSLLLQLQMEVPYGLNIKAAEYMHSRSKLVMLDCGGREDQIGDDLLQHLTLVSPNETELVRIVGESVVQENEVGWEGGLTKLVKEKLLAKHPHLIVLLKLGKHGSLLLSKEVEVRVFGAPHYNEQILQDYKILDTVGAGDCFTSAFCTRLLERCMERQVSTHQQLLALPTDEQIKIFKEAMRFASSAAFLCITQEGAMPSMPKKQDVDDFIGKYFPK